MCNRHKTTRDAEKSGAQTTENMTMWWVPRFVVRFGSQGIIAEYFENVHKYRQTASSLSVSPAGFSRPSSSLTLYPKPGLVCVSGKIKTVWQRLGSGVVGRKCVGNKVFKVLGVRSLAMGKKKDVC